LSREEEEEEEEKEAILYWIFYGRGQRRQRPLFAGKYYCFMLGSEGEKEKEKNADIECHAWGQFFIYVSAKQTIYIYTQVVVLL
jgi:hypothetical protein